jgi:hypothetical protein
MLAADSPPVVIAAAMPAVPDQADGSVIIVNGGRFRGGVDGPVLPEATLDAEAVSALGASSIADILSQVASLTGGAQGRAGDGPVLLVNGRRIGSFEDVRNLPPEAIRRVEVLPEEAALRLGYPATVKPVNIVLKDKYAAVTGELEDRATTRGLRNDFNTELNAVRISGDNRLTFDVQYQIGDAITEAKRGVLRPLDARAASLAGVVSSLSGSTLAPLAINLTGVPASGRAAAAFAAAKPTDQTAAFHTLVPQTTQFTAALAFARALPGAKSLSVTARYDRLTARDGLGPALADLTIAAGGVSPFTVPVRLRRIVPGLAPSVRDSVIDTAHLGLQLAGYGAWQWSLAGNFDRVALHRQRTGGTDASALQAAIGAGALADPFGPAGNGLVVGAAGQRSRSIDDTVLGEAFLAGPLARLPAGDLHLALRGSVGTEHQSVTQPGFAGAFDRRRVGGQAALDVPLLTSHAPIGALDAQANLGFDRYSDAGTITARGAGLVWRPDKALSLLGSYLRDSTVPTIAQLGAPSLITPDAAFYDFASGSSLSAARTDGGNRNLIADRRRVWKAEASAKVPGGWSLTATYTALADRSPVVAFPGVTRLVEAAFPGLIQRDVGGAITAVDARLINAAREDRRELKLALGWGRTFTKGGGPRVPGGGTFGGGHAFGASGSMIQATLTDTIRLSDRLVLASGQPAIDLVSGNTLGEGLRVPRHRIETTVSGSHHGFGLRGNATWTSQGSAGTGLPGALRFSDRFATNLRLFWFPAKTPGIAGRWLEGVRLLLAIDNLTDSYQRVADRNGATPLAYQRGLVDPIGRTIRLSIRKTFD